MLEVDLFRKNRTIVGQSNTTDELAQRHKVLLDRADLAAASRPIDNLVKFVLLDQHTSFKDVHCQLDCLGNCHFNAQLSNKLYVDVMQGDELGADSFCEDVVQEPIQIQFSAGPLDQRFQLLHFLFEVGLAGVVANELDVLLALLVR